MEHQYEYKVGDMVRIREWNDMENEFGLWLNHIETPGWLFVEEMRKICGEEYEITRITPHPAYCELELFNNDFHITTAMVVPATEANKEFSVNDWNSLMGVV